jgi:hypothetical protein
MPRVVPRLVLNDRTPLGEDRALANRTLVNATIRRAIPL